jgi:hypothetical protein
MTDPTPEEMIEFRELDRAAGDAKAAADEAVAKSNAAINRVSQMLVDLRIRHSAAGMVPNYDTGGWTPTPGQGQPAPLPLLVGDPGHNQIIGRVKHRGKRR